MTQPIRRFLALSPADRWLLLQAIGALPMMALAVRTLGPGRCYRFLVRMTPVTDASARCGAGVSLRALHTGRLVGIAARRGLVRSSCLVRSMTVWWFLRRQKIPCQLHIGVRKQQDRLEAHAWIEHEGRVIDDDADVSRRYAPFSGARGVFAQRGVELP